VVRANAAVQRSAVVPGRTIPVPARQQRPGARTFRNHQAAAAGPGRIPARRLRRITHAAFHERGSASGGADHIPPGKPTAHGLRLEGRALGDIKASAKSQNAGLQVQLDTNFLSSNVKAAGEWRLTSGYPGQVTATFSRISLAEVRAWLGKSSKQDESNFDG